MTVVALLGPHLTETNHRQLLADAHHKSKRDIESPSVSCGTAGSTSVMSYPISPAMAPSLQAALILILISIPPHGRGGTAGVRHSDRTAPHSGISSGRASVSATNVAGSGWSDHAGIWWYGLWTLNPRDFADIPGLEIVGTR